MLWKHTHGRMFNPLGKCINYKSLKFICTEFTEWFHKDYFLLITMQYNLISIGRVECHLMMPGLSKDIYYQEWHTLYSRVA